MESQAYAFRSRGDEYVLRLNREVRGFRKDALAYRKFGREDLPVPEVVEIGETAEGLFYCVSRKLRGRTLQDLRPSQIPATLEATVRVMQAIADSSIESIRGFGPFDHSGHAGFASWRDFLLSQTLMNHADSELAAIVHRLADFCPETRCLVHGDFGSNNVLTDGRTITGVLDWSEAMIGDPLWDVANVFFWRGWLDCMAQLANYLSKHLHPLPHWRERVLCYQACIALRELAQITADSTA
jgi:hygromycin-B 4-O-kinase